MSFTLRPSASSRWGSCSGSLLVKDDSTNESAKRGTRIHKNAELLFANELDFDDNNEEHLVAKNYVDHIKDRFGESDIQIELPIQITNTCKGTADLVVTEKMTGHMFVADLKTGNNPVETTSKQLKIYALGIMLTYEVDYVTVIVYQHERMKEQMYNREELEPLYQEILNIEYQVSAGIFRFNASYEACKYCPAINDCTFSRDHIKNNVLELRKKNSGYQHYKYAVEAKKLSDMVIKETLDKMLNGKAFHKLKIGKTRSRLKWKDEAKVISILKDVGADDLINFKLPTPKQLMSKRDDLNLIEHIVEVEGNPKVIVDE